MNTPSSISDRVAVIAEPQFVQHMSGIAHAYTDKPLLIVLAERKLSDSEHRQSCNGVADALKHAEANPEQNVLLLSFFKLEMLVQRKEDTALFLQLPNAFFAEMPVTKSALMLKKHDNTDEIRQTAGKALVSLISALNHTTEKHFAATEESVNAVLAERSVEVKRVQAYFPELRNLTGKAFITELKKLRDELPITEVMPGKEIAGVYCDIEGTLLIDGVLQEAVLQQLHDYAAQGSQVTIWTLGNVAELELLIRNAGVQYPVRSKMDYSGAIAEIVIDNDSEETFRAKTKITPKQFIQV